MRNGRDSKTGVSGEKIVKSEFRLKSLPVGLLGGPRALAKAPGEDRAFPARFLAFRTF